MEFSFVKIEQYLNSFKSSNAFLPTTLFILLVLIFYLKSKKRTIYLLDYACYKPPPTLRVPFSTFIEHAMIVFKDNPKVARFQMRILERAGLGDETGLPPALQFIPPEPSFSRTHDEAHLVIFSSIDELLKKTGVRPNNIGILITNCSIFCPTPSLSSMIMNKYKLRSCTKTFSLSGMGCSASAISLDLAKRLLQVMPNSYALVVSTEILTPNCYMGLERSMTVPGCLFRLGCSSLLLTNKREERYRAKYQLLHTIRTHIGANDASYTSVMQQEDEEGRLGIALSKDLLVVAGEALTLNITTLGPLVLPLSEKLKFAYNYVARKISSHKKIKAYIPNFNKAFDHFCIHAGGRAVIEEIQKALRLSAQDVEASRMNLYRFGNTSSSSIWYELSYIEAKGKMKKGERVWQIAFGSGFKCNSIVLKCNRNIDPKIDGFGPWKDCIQMYPMDVPEIRKL
ncbi:3-ketoacyl-CoA synthase 5-like [Chenopodium quinoa]|uniref:3-ketoacyl-CoA synthase n=1 Tax=Chenopodium quinoa TaxID=63459 RepID=A0A803M4E1_CHEQI|nr:3-ketoacyl-CoA synthase 5-like [Chenopodium quinoa]